MRTAQGPRLIEFYLYFVVDFDQIKGILNLFLKISSCHLDGNLQTYEESKCEKTLRLFDLKLCPFLQIG